jgi:hypothetical protein
MSFWGIMTIGLLAISIVMLGVLAFKRTAVVAVVLAVFGGLSIIMGIVSAGVMHFGALGEYNAFVRLKREVEQLYNSTNILHQQEMALQVTVKNQWLLNSKISLDTYGLFSSYWTMQDKIYSEQLIVLEDK